MDITVQKRVLALFLFVALSLSLLYFFPSKLLFTQKEGDTISSSQASQILVINKLEDPKDDPDNDNIPNWQETILGTDPHSQNEINTEAFPISKEEQNRLQDGNNLTVALAKNNITVASYAKEVDASSTIDYEGLSVDVLRSTAANFSLKSYTERDIKNIASSTAKTRKTYGNVIAYGTAVVINKYISVDDKAGLKDIVEGVPNTKNIKELQEKAVGVRKFVSELLLMPVPEDALSVHIDYVNSVAHYAETLEGFLTVNEDPLRAALLLKGYKDIVQAQIKYLTAFEVYFTATHTLFSNKEAGYIFTHGI